MKNKIEDIIKSKNNKQKKTASPDDMFSKLAEERAKKSIPNTFQYRQEENASKLDQKKEIIKKIENPIKIVKTINNENDSKDSFQNNDRLFLYKNKNTKKKFGKYLFFLGAFIVFAFFILNFFASVKIFITPKVESFTFNNEKFTADQKNNENLTFEVMIVEGKEEKTVSFSNIEKLSTKAKGTVVIYNEYSTSPQKLLINTRLSDDDGLVYMTDKAITVPGYTKSGTKIIPGSVMITVTAQESGDKYNSELKDFKIVGFKGTPKYEKIYARAKTGFSGGASGDFYIPTDKERGEINTDLEIKLKNALSKKIEAEIPEGYIFYPQSTQFVFSIDKNKFLSESKEANIEANGKLSTVIFKEDLIKNEIIKKSYPKAEDKDFKEIIIPEIKNLEFRFLDPNFKISKETESISFELTGSFTLEWHLLIDELKESLVGVSKKDMDAIFASDPGISKVRVIFRPPWQKKIPKDLQRIKIIEENIKV